MYVQGNSQGPDLQNRPTKQATFFEGETRLAPFSAGRDFSRACKEQKGVGSHRAILDRKRLSMTSQEVQGLWN